MFKRIIIEDWHVILILIAFALTFGAFIVLTARAILMKKKHRQHMADLPLQDEKPIPAKRDEKKS